MTFVYCCGNWIEGKRDYCYLSSCWKSRKWYLWLFTKGIIIICTYKVYNKGCMQVQNVQDSTALVQFYKKNDDINCLKNSLLIVSNWNRT